MIGNAISTNPEEFNFSVVNNDMQDFSITVSNDNNLDIFSNLSVSYDNERNWIIPQSDTLTVNANSTGDYHLTLNPYYLTEGTYKAFINIRTQYQQLVTIPVNLQITAEANENVIELTEGINIIYPNPFKPFTSPKDNITIEFAIKEKAITQISVYNLKGEKVKTLLNSQIQKGKHKLYWNGKNDSGEYVANGVYLYKMVVNGKNVSTKKLMILK